MDKKNYPYQINGAAAVAIIDAWVANNGGGFFWALTPDDLKARILAACDAQGNISMTMAHLILDNSSTCKMHGLANRGFEYFKQEWKKIRF